MLRELPRHHNHPQQQQQQQQQEDQVKPVQLFSEVLPRQYLNKQDLPPRWVFLSMTIITGVTMTKSKLFSIDVHAFQWLRQLRQLRSAITNLASPLLPAALSLLQHPLHLPLPPLHRPRDQGGAFPMDRPLPRPALHLDHL